MRMEHKWTELEKMLKMKQNDWVEVCGEIDKLKAELEAERAVKTKIVVDFKRGDEVPANAKFISSREFIKTEDFDGGHPQEWDTRIVERYWIDTYEVERQAQRSTKDSQEVNNGQNKELSEVIAIMPPGDLSYIYLHSHATFVRVDISKENIEMIRAYLDLAEKSQGGVK